MASMKNFILRLDLFREPAEPSRAQLFAPSRRSYVLQIVVGLLCLCSSLLFSTIRGMPLALGLGAFIILKAVAELLPKDHRIPAGVLRLVAGVALALGLIGTLSLLSVGR